MSIKRNDYLSIAIYPFVLAFCVLSSSCAGLIPVNVTINSVEPAKIHIGESPDAGIVGVSGGRRNLQDVLVEELINQSRSKGFFTIKNRLGEGIRFDVQDDQPILTGKEIELGENEILISGLIVETDMYNEEKEVKKRVKKEGKNVTVKVNVTFTIGEAVVAFSVISMDRIYMMEREFDGKYEVEKSKAPSRNEMYELAVKNSVSKFLKDVTPSNIRAQVKIDKSDKGQESIIGVIKKGNIEEARKMLAEYVVNFPNSAPGYYNLAVLTDATGHYEEALLHYNKAISLGGENYYVQSKSECMKRMANKKVLQGT